jgi:TonB family protein
MTVEVTLGGTTAAGLASVAGEEEVQIVSSEIIAPDEPVAQEVQASTVMPQNVPVAAQDAAPETKPQQETEVQTVEQTTQERLPEPETALAEGPAVTSPTEQPPEPVTESAQVATAQAPERTRIEAPTQKEAAQQQQASAAPTDAASGIGRGRSAPDVNYNGTIAAHLSRFKQYPADARAAGAQGAASVSFGIDGGGRVTSVSLARGSGIASIDREVVAMVRRASPFPPPPDGRGRDFTVPVRFNLR